jgi:predicted transcriptional regulator
MLIKTETESLLLDDVKKEILELCTEPHGKAAILEHIQVPVNQQNYSKFIVKLLDQRFIASGFLRKRSSANQEYIITQKGLNYLKAIA